MGKAQRLGIVERQVYRLETLAEITRAPRLCHCRVYAWTADADAPPPSSSNQAVPASSGAPGKVLMKTGRKTDAPARATGDGCGREHGCS